MQLLLLTWGGSAGKSASWSTARAVSRTFLSRSQSLAPTRSKAAAADWRTTRGCAQSSSLIPKSASAGHNRSSSRRPTLQGCRLAAASPPYSLGLDSALGPLERRALLCKGSG